jgi:hypothetical protein
LTFDCIGPEGAAAEEGFTSLVATFNSFGKSLVATHSAALKENDEFISLSAFVGVEKAGSSIKTFGLRIDGIEDFFIKAGVFFGKDKDEKQEE